MLLVPLFLFHAIHQRIQILTSVPLENTRWKLNVKRERYYSERERYFIIFSSRINAQTDMEGHFFGTYKSDKNNIKI
jgi:hypothetical protein